MAYTIGLDYGTNSVRCVVVNTKNGMEIAASVFSYPSGQDGIILDPADHNLARQLVQDYIIGLEDSVNDAVESANSKDPDFAKDKVVAIGIDTTGSTPIPVDKFGTPLCMLEEFRDNPNAMAWLWKDHTGYAEAIEITELAKKQKPHFLDKCGGTYSSEWFFSKILHCLRVDPKVYDAAYTWVEHADYMTAILTGNQQPENIKRCRCAAGHKAMFSDQWQGYPDREFLTQLDDKLAKLSDTLPDKTYPIDTQAGTLTKDWAQRLSLPEGIPVAMAAFDAHLGAVGSGIKEGTLVKIIGTSACDMAVFPNTEKLSDIPGICGIVDGSVLPGCFGLEAGQSAVGDIFNWFVNYIQPGGKDAGSHEELTNKASKLLPGQSGLLALDWNNGNRTILVDQRLTGLLIGQTLHTKPEEIYRALIEATAFGALTIINRFDEYGVKINEIITCGGIAEKNPMLMQIYADVTGREMKVAASSQACALGSAVAAAVVAGEYENFGDAQKAMTSVKPQTYKPIDENHNVYKQLYKLYRQLHDNFANDDNSQNMANIMKELLEIKERVNS